MMSSYANATIALATKHGKEDIIAPLFQKYLGARITVPQIDTDRFGTFSGDVSRVANARETAIQKAQLAIEKTGLSYGLASEGSFGPHPFLPFIACDQEILVFIDKKNGFILHELESSEVTNYTQDSFSSLEDAEGFIESTQFPSHALIVRPNQWDNKDIIFKGLRTKEDLENAFTQCQQISGDGKVWIETDMRAHMNPTRMKVIATVAEKLVKRLSTFCPACNAPGWGQVGREAVLPCELCGTPSDMTLRTIFGCVLCSHQVKQPRPDGLTHAPAAQCAVCNP